MKTIINSNRFPLERSHIVQFFETDTALSEAVARFVATGLGDNGGVLVIATSEHIEAIEEILLDRETDVQGAKATGQLLFLDAVKTLAAFSKGGRPDRDLFNQVIGGLIQSLSSQFPKIYAYGEMVGLLWKDGHTTGTIALEQLWSNLCRTHSLILFCGYDLHGFEAGEDASAFAEVCNAHTHVLPSESFPDLENQDEQLRAIALLQQQALSLSAELKRRKRAEAELEDFFENSIVPLHWVGPDGTILRANRAELDLLGYSQDEYIGRHIGEFHADSNTIKSILARLAQGQPIQSYPARLKCKDGSIKHVLIDSNVYFENGKFVHTRCFARDVTKQVEAEASLRESELLNRLIIDNTRDCIKVLDLDGRIIFMNRGGLEITEICDLTAVQDSCWLDFWQADVRAQAVGAFNAARAGEVREFTAFAPTTKTKISKWWSITLSPILDPQGKVVRVLCVSHDITDQVKSQETVRELEARKQEEKFRLLVEGIKDYAIFMLDPEGKVVTWGGRLANQERRFPLLGQRCHYRNAG
ncbi:MAG: PAS domain S-box protein [Bdellovibrionales bacterium]